MTEETLEVLRNFGTAKEALDFVGSGTLRLSDSESGEVVLTQEVAFRFVLQPLGEDCQLTCWSQDMSKTKYGVWKAAIS